MEYVEGLDLRRMVKAKGPMPIGHACYFVHQAALGLQHAHEEGMVHRDIKPANLMLSHHKNRPVIKVLDFGLSKAVSEQNASELTIGIPSLPMDFGEHLTCTGAMLGTPDFIAPEQIVDSQRADIRADIYSLGCTLYYLLSGHPPYPDRSLQELLRAHCSLDARPLVAVRAEVPAELSMLVARMMAREPAGRFQEPAEIAHALTPFFKKGSVTVVGSKRDTSQVGQAAAGGPADATRPSPMLEGLIDYSETDPLFDMILDTTPPEAGPDLLERGTTAVAKRRRLGPRGWWAAAGVLLLGLFGAWWAVILKTQHGVIVLENVPANAVVEIDGDRLTAQRHRRRTHQDRGPRRQTRRARQAGRRRAPGRERGPPIGEATEAQRTSRFSRGGTNDESGHRHATDSLGAFHTERFNGCRVGHAIPLVPDDRALERRPQVGS